MPTTIKQNKAKKSRALQIMSDIENLDVILVWNHFDSEESEDNILARRPESASCNASDNEERPHLNTRENGSGSSTDRGQNSTGASSSAEFNKLSGELNFRISRETDEMMNSVSVQIQRAINDAISNQILPQIQNSFKAGSGQTTQKGWNVPLRDRNMMPKIAEMTESGVTRTVSMCVLPVELRVFELLQKFKNCTQI